MLKFGWDKLFLRVFSLVAIFLNQTIRRSPHKNGFVALSAWGGLIKPPYSFTKTQRILIKLYEKSFSKLVKVICEVHFNIGMVWLHFSCPCRKG